MALLHRRESPPPSARTRLGGDDRILSWADVEGGGTLVASRLGLWWPEGDTTRLIGWQFIDKAVWREGMLGVTEADIVDDLLLVDRAPISLRLHRPRDLPIIVRRRVEANIVRTEMHPLPGGAGRFVARRMPGVDGVHWWVRLEPGTADSPEVRTEARAQIDQLRALWSAAAG